MSTRNQLFFNLVVTINCLYHRQINHLQMNVNNWKLKKNWKIFPSLFSFLVLPSASSCFPLWRWCRLPALPPLVPRKAGSTALFRVTPPSGLPWSGSLRDSRTRVWLIHTSRPNNLTHWFQRGQTVSIIPHHHTSGTLHTTVISACGFSSSRPPWVTHTHTHTRSSVMFRRFQLPFYGDFKFTIPLNLWPLNGGIPSALKSDWWAWSLMRIISCLASRPAQRLLISAESCTLIHG